GRRIIFEYSMIKNLNDNTQCAKELSSLLKGLPCHVNLINLNYVKEKGLQSSGKEPLQEFLKVLVDNGISATIRRTMGSDIEGACGQLRRKILKNE
ncbi:MAG: 23S rRNA (adenine(2503)-C(2))-methyltransferase RlmN, partial [Clostridia bacterium]|nr:23S rRNA (adenine(2503)-C(2))-methyltransferase RlmN [Clostridia bacterium]